MKIIISTQNPIIKSIYALRLQKERNKQHLFVAEGIRTCSTLINSGAAIQMIYTVEKLVPTAQKIISTDKITCVTTAIMKKISQVATPSGILGVFKIPKAPSPQQLKPGLVLANVSDPGNMGTLIRTAAAMNISSVILIEGTDPWNSKVVQASAGFITQVNLFQWSWNELLKHKRKYILAALVVSNGTSINTINKKETLLVVGNEAHGIPEEWLKTCEKKITLPMPGNIESLNASVAGSIALYELHVKN